jgi:hypothetical protein
MSEDNHSVGERVMVKKEKQSNMSKNECVAELEKKIKAIEKAMFQHSP